MSRGDGASSVGYDPYLAILGSDGRMYQGTWRQEFSKTLRKLLRFRVCLGKALLTHCEGEHQTLAIELTIGRLLELFHRRQAYDNSFHAVRRLRNNLDAQGRDSQKPGK
jgi:hypothetical protein